MAFFHIGRYGIGRTIEADDYNFASKILNSMVKAWQAMGLHLWTKQEGIVFLTPYVGEYNLGDYAYFATKDNSTVVKLTDSYELGDSTLSVSSSTDMTVGDNIGIVLDTGYTHWTTITAIPSSTSITIETNLTGDAAEDNLVYSFPSPTTRPLRVLDARLVTGIELSDSTTQTEIPMTSIAYQDYWNIAAVTTSSSQPNQFNYTPKVSNGTLYVWPKPNTSTCRIQLTYERSIEDLDSLDDDFDFPSEWLEALQWQLALRLCSGYGKADKLAYISQIAGEMLDNIKHWDNEITYVRFTPDTGNYDG